MSIKVATTYTCDRCGGTHETKGTPGPHNTPEGWSRIDHGAPAIHPAAHNIDAEELWSGMLCIPCTTALAEVLAGGATVTEALNHGGRRDQLRAMLDATEVETVLAAPTLPPMCANTAQLHGDPDPVVCVRETGHDGSHMSQAYVDGRDPTELW